MWFNWYARGRTIKASEHVEEIRRKMLSISGDPNLLFTEDLHQAAEILSTKLYPQDADVLMELIQEIADDSDFPEGVDPSLEFMITSKDITSSGAPATLLVFNNDKGFSHKNIESMCGVGNSTKTGIGFRSVFLITDEPHVFSNDYRIRFHERPCQHCNISFIVPEWIEQDPMISAIQSVYGSAAALPTTTLVLPLKPDKVKAVKDQLSSIHHEVLLFLSNIKRLSVTEKNDDPKVNTVSAISISSEKDFATSKSKGVSYTSHLTVGHTVYAYYMWEQRFDVMHENRVDIRPGVDKWVITLAFPLEQRSILNSLPGIYSILPTEIDTNFPFIIQSDFLLASSRRNILWDNKWNQGILDCVPDAFVNAFTALVKSTENAPISNLRYIFQFLPVNESSHPLVNHVRDAINEKLMKETIVPCESYTGEKLYRKPIQVGWVRPAFWSILNNARSQGLNFSYRSFDEAFLLAPWLCTDEYIVIRIFLEIRTLGCSWYAICIESSYLAMHVSENVYIQLLEFIAETWNFWSDRTIIKKIPLIKYAGWDGDVHLLTLVDCTDSLLAAESGSGSDSVSWLINWNTEFHCPNGGGNREFYRSKGRAFLPKATQKLIQVCPKKAMLMNWLKEEADVKFVSVCKYAEFLSVSVEFNPKLAVTYARFLYTSLEMDYLSIHEVQNLCSKMPIVDKYRQVNVRKCSSLVPSVALTCKPMDITESRQQIYNQRLVASAAPLLTPSKQVMEIGEILVPAQGSRWMELFLENPWPHENYVELGEDYTRSVDYHGGVISGIDLLSFLITYAKVSDVPHLSPPNAAIPILSTPLTKGNTFMLLDWIRYIMTSWISLPKLFLLSIQNNSWLKVSLSGCPGYCPPSESFMLDSTIGNFLQDGLLPVDIPLVDEKFYGVKIKKYKEELQAIGVKIRDSEACEYIATRLMFLAASSELTTNHVLWILRFIEFLGTNHISSQKFIGCIRGEKWVSTSQGNMIPTASVLFSQEWNAASQISDLPRINQNYYGEEVLSYKKQLGLLGVAVNVDKSYQLLLDNLKSSSSLTCLSPEAMLLLLRCIKSLEWADERVQAIKNTKCLKTSLDYKCPSECFLLNPDQSQWGCLLQVFGSFPVIDEQFYGSFIFSMSSELKKIGVMVNFEDTIQEFTHTFRKQARQSSITKEHVLSFLQCYRQLKKLELKFPDEFENCIRQEKWIRTRLGDYRSPNHCILSGNDSEPIVSPTPPLDFIDDTNFYGNEIHDYLEELKVLGVVTDFKDVATFIAAA